MRDLSAYTTFPFELPVSVRPLAEPVPLEPDRDGEDGVDCWLCSTPDEAFLWTDERWRLSLSSPSSQRGVVLLQPRVHAQSFGDLPPAEAAELGPMVGRVQQAVLDLGGIGRVHVHYWGDGSAHLHVWFYPRPYGQLELRGTFRTLWAEVLPELPDEEGPARRGAGRRHPARRRPNRRRPARRRPGRRGRPRGRTPRLGREQLLRQHPQPLGRVRVQRVRRDAGPGARRCCSASLQSSK